MQKLGVPKPSMGGPTLPHVTCSTWGPLSSLRMSPIPPHLLAGKASLNFPARDTPTLLCSSPVVLPAWLPLEETGTFPLLMTGLKALESVIRAQGPS